MKKTSPPLAIERKSKGQIELSKTILLRRMSKRLKEAVVTASKIMMVNKGDTIVYNADYFQLAEGSMLDQLISRLPGVKLESGGRITVNGNFVSSLLINGKDFFKGDATVALENLPAYMVSKVKAYQRAPDNAYITRTNPKAEGTDPWVIDVNLKRQYAQGWIANAEAGYGTHARYFGRIFGLRFTDKTRLSIFGNANNLNDNSQPGREGNWESIEPILGQSKMQKGGISYGVQSTNQKTNFTSDFIVKHNEDDVLTQTSTVTFLPLANSYVRSRNQSLHQNTDIDLQTTLSHSARKVYVSWENFFFYGKSSNQGCMQSMESATDFIESYRGALIDSIFVMQNYKTIDNLTNYYQDKSMQDTKNRTYISSLYTNISLPHSHYVTLQISGRYSHANDDLFSHYNLLTPKAETTKIGQNKYQTMPRHEYQWWANANAPLLNKRTLEISASYTYRQEYYSDCRQLYRLDSLGGSWTTLEGRMLGMLPSTSDSLMKAIDYANTYTSSRHVYKHSPELLFQFSFKKEGSLYISLPFNVERDVLNDLRMRENRSHINKRYVGFEPRIQFNLQGFELVANRQLSVPTMTFLLDVRDDSNPLAIKQGNPSLKPTDIYSISTKYSKTLTQHAQAYYVGAHYQCVNNAIGQSLLYDTATGITTFTPRNMNGNWTLDANGGYARSLDGKQMWSISTDATWMYNHSVDFVQTEHSAEDQARSIVRNNTLDANLALRYRQKSLSLSLTSSSKWQHATSAREDFSTINSLDMLYGLAANVKLPWGMAFNTDCTLHTRSGYADKTMNTHEWLWNAEVTQSLLKKKTLILKLRAYDLLHQRHNIVRTLNAQGRTETWHNTTPNYILLTISYRLNVMPKKR